MIKFDSWTTSLYNNLENYFCNRKDLIRLSEGHDLEERGRRGSISGFLRSFSFWCWDISRIYSDSFLFHSHGCVKPHTKKLGVQFASKHFQYLHLLYSKWLELIPTELFSFYQTLSSIQSWILHGSSFAVVLTKAAQPEPEMSIKSDTAQRTTYPNKYWKKYTWYRVSLKKGTFSIFILFLF